GTPERKTPYYCITRKKESGEETNVYDLSLCDTSGKLFVDIQGFEMVKLNQLEEKDRISDKVSFSNEPAKKNKVRS
ncbi:MAG: hypothetical protein MI863_12040, partial [Desulfobacterales bacterium]|nr:hypothetical protein [Desulfobacterales bacterium]